MGLKESGQIGGIKVHPVQHQHRVAGGARLAVRPERRARRLQDHRRRQDVEEDAVRQQRDRRPRHRGRLGESRHALRRRCTRASARAGTSSAAARPAKAASTSRPTAARRGSTSPTACRKDLIGKIDIDIARSNPRVLYAMVEALGNQGGLYRSNDAGETWTLRQQQPAPARAAVLLPLRQRQPEERERSLGQRARACSKSTDGGKTFTVGRDAARRQPRHVVQPRQPAASSCRSTTAAPTSA